MSLQKFVEPNKDCECSSWNHCTSTPHRSETNGIAERAVRWIKEGTSAVLLQSGLDEEWWADSMECCCYLRNIQDLLSDGKTPHERRFGETIHWTSNSVWFDGRISPLFLQSLVATASVRQESLTRNILRLCIIRGENLERRHFGRRHGGIGKDGRIRNPSLETQCKGSVNAQKW